MAETTQETVAEGFAGSMADAAAGTLEETTTTGPLAETMAETAAEQEELITTAEAMTLTWAECVAAAVGETAAGPVEGTTMAGLVAGTVQGTNTVVADTDNAFTTQLRLGTQRVLTDTMDGITIAELVAGTVQETNTFLADIRNAITTQLRSGTKGVCLKSCYTGEQLVAIALMLWDGPLSERQMVTSLETIFNWFYHTGDRCVSLGSEVEKALDSFDLPVQLHQDGDVLRYSMPAAHAARLLGLALIFPH